jgi:hypothetical protein
MDHKSGKVDDATKTAECDTGLWDLWRRSAELLSEDQLPLEGWERWSQTKRLLKVVATGLVKPRPSKSAEVHCRVPTHPLSLLTRTVLCLKNRQDGEQRCSSRQLRAASCAVMMSMSS